MRSRIAAAIGAGAWGSIGSVADVAAAEWVRRSVAAASRPSTTSSSTAAPSGRTCEATHASAPPAMPPAVAPVPMRPTTLRAVCGSKRSFTSDQKPETKAPPNAETWR